MALEVIAGSNRFYFTPIIMLIGLLKEIGCVDVRLKGYTMNTG
jgi:hypothetical protein